MERSIRTIIPFQILPFLYIIHLVYELCFYILEVPRYTNIVDIGAYLILTYIERLFSVVCYFLSYFCYFVNCMSQVGKFHNCFQICSEIEASFIFEGFYYCHLWKVQFQFSSSFLAFFIWSVSFPSHFLSQFLMLINCMSRVFDFRDVQKLEHKFTLETF